MPISKSSINPMFNLFHRELAGKQSKELTIQALKLSIRNTLAVNNEKKGKTWLKELPVKNILAAIDDCEKLLNLITPKIHTPEDIKNEHQRLVNTYKNHSSVDYIEIHKLHIQLIQRLFAGNLQELLDLNRQENIEPSEQQVLLELNKSLEIKQQMSLELIIAGNKILLKELLMSPKENFILYFNDISKKIVELPPIDQLNENIVLLNTWFKIYNHAFDAAESNITSKFSNEMIANNDNLRCAILIARLLKYEYSGTIENTTDFLNFFKEMEQLSSQGCLRATSYILTRYERGAFLATQQIIPPKSPEEIEYIRKLAFIQGDFRLSLLGKIICQSYPAEQNNFLIKQIQPLAKLCNHPNNSSPEFLDKLTKKLTPPIIALIEQPPNEPINIPRATEILLGEYRKALNESKDIITKCKTDLSAHPYRDDVDALIRLTTTSKKSLHTMLFNNKHNKRELPSLPIETPEPPLKIHKK